MPGPPAQPQPRPSQPERSGSAWTQRDRLAAAGIFVLALAIRLLHLQQIEQHDPFFGLPSVDPRMYHEWALRISGGDWLGDEVFYLGPLYAYALGLLYWVFGPSFLVAKAFQCLLGAATCVGVFAVSREVFDRRAAILAGLLAAGYAMLVFYAGSLLIVNLQVPLVLLVVWLSLRGLRDPRPLRWLLTGAVLGLAALARQTALLYAPLLVAWLLLGLRERLGRRLLLAALFCLGAAVVIAPATLRNFAVSGDFVLVTSTGGYSLWQGNHPRAHGTFQPVVIGGIRLDHPLEMREGYTRLAEEALGGPLEASEVSDFWRKRTFDYVLSEPGAWLRLEARKLGYFLNRTEVWSNRSRELSRAFSWVLALPLPAFALTAPLGLVGLCLSARRWRHLVPLYCAMAAYLGFALIFFVLSRYRMPFEVLLLPFAGFAAVEIWDTLRAKQWPRLAFAAALLVASIAIVHIPLPGPNLSMAYYNLGNKYRSLQEWEPAIESYVQALRIDRSNISFWNNLAIALENSADHHEQAVEAWRTVLRWGQQRGNARYTERAERHLRALGVDPDAADGGSMPPAEPGHETP
ncbi:MAG: glycosyltransferase family 39 protein [Myxococcota bacterium]